MGGGRQATLPATGEPAWRAHNRLTQLQRPLSGSFLKGLPVPFRCFHADECTALSCFRFGIPLPNLAQGLGNDMWGDKVLSKTGAMHQRRHDQLRDELARACRGIRSFHGHTELRVGSNLYVDLTVFGGLGDATFVHPLDLDVHIHHLYGQYWTRAMTTGYDGLRRATTGCPRSECHKFEVCSKR